MTRIDPVWAGVTELSQAFAARTLSPVDAVDALLERIERRDGLLHSFIAVYADDARLAAEGADRAIRSGHRMGPLHGVPIGLKDLVDLEGRVTTGGSKVWANRVSPVTATLAERAIAAGMIVLGKTHTVEFAMGSWGTNTHMGTPRNPWDLAVHRTPGGSSSGSAVVVAAGLAPIAIGTDTGGSVRLPAGWCGIVGLKVTAGRISTYGVLPLSFTLDTPGPIARSVEDAAILFRLLNGPDPLDPQTLRGLRPIPAHLAARRAGLRIAVMPDAERAGVDREVPPYGPRWTRYGLAQVPRVTLLHRFGDYATATGGSSVRRAIACGPPGDDDAAHPSRAAAHPASRGVARATPARAGRAGDAPAASRRPRRRRRPPDPDRATPPILIEHRPAPRHFTPT
jgi:aspartyl-tRNA(Asn)/glutamyl-tRNA(Gln) amidotransferase subunit A